MAKTPVVTNEVHLKGVIVAVIAMFIGVAMLKQFCGCLELASDLQLISSKSMVAA